MTPPTPTTVLVLGMHRSGTSAVARVLNLLGVYLGDDLLPPAADNQTGFWEDRPVQHLHDRVYEDLGRDWTQVSPLPPAWWEDPRLEDRRRQLRQSLDSRFNGRPMWGIKDPRLAAMAPLWQPVLAELATRPVALIVFRSPAEVARSLAKRDGFAASRSHLLWLRAMLDAVRNTADMPRAITTHERVLADWRTETGSLADRLAVAWPDADTNGPEIDAFINPGGRHHVIGDDEFLADESVPGLVRKTYQSVLAAVDAGDVGALIPVADAVEAELADRTATGRFVLDFEALHRRSVIDRNVNEGQLRGRIGVETARAESAELRATEVDRRAIAAEGSAAAEGARADHAEARAAGAETRAAAAEAEGVGLRAGLAASDRRTAEAQERLRESVAAHRQADRDRADLTRSLENKAKDAAELAGRLATADKQARQLREQLAAVRSELSTAYQTRDALGRSLARTFSSRLWRWGRPAYWVARALGLLRVDAGMLIPLKPAHRPDGAWRGVVQPEFLVPTPPVRGWVRLRAKVRASTPSRAALYLDTGSGFHQREHVELSPVAGETEIDRMIAVRKTVYLIRFDPVQAPGEYALESFSLEPVSAIWFNTSAFCRNVYRMIRGTGAHRPSVGVGLRLLLGGRWRAFHQQLVSNVESTTAVSEYDLWRKAHAITDDCRAEMRREVAGWPHPPTISVVVPVYNVAEKYLRACLDSVLAQIYPHWELCVADDASPKTHVRKVLAEYAAKDPRIKVAFRPANGNISAASNSALDLATGDFVALLDHDDTIAEHALLAVARVIVDDPAVDMIYSDEDKLTPAGKHVDPFFKPDWSPEYFLACMYTCHLGVYRTNLIRKIGGWRSEFDSAQDYDLVLRTVAAGARVRHISDVLYHWRAIASSTAAGGDAKPEAHDRARAALADHLRATGRPGTVGPGPSEGFHRVRYAIFGKPLVSVVIPSACREAELHGRPTWFVLDCVASIRKLSSYANLEVVVLDNADMPVPLSDALKPLGVRVSSFTGAFNLARKMNQGAAAARGEHLILLNDDVEVITPDWVESMLEFSQQPEIGAVGAQLLFPDDTQQHNGVNVLEGNPGHPFYRFPADHPGYFFSSAVHRNWSAVTGACLMTRRDVFESVGGFSERFPLNYNDVDYCLKVIESGKRIVQVPYAKLYHHESVSKVGNDEAELAAFKARWADRIPRDPYYNPNLTTQTCDFRIRL